MSEIIYKFVEPYEKVIRDFYNTNNNSNIELFNEKNQKVSFSQVAIIPINNSFYMILLPIDKMEGFGENEGVIFEIKTINNIGKCLSLVLDSKTIDVVFDEYERLSKL